MVTIVLKSSTNRELPLALFQILALNPVVILQVCTLVMQTKKHPGVQALKGS